MAAVVTAPARGSPGGFDSTGRRTRSFMPEEANVNGVGIVDLSNLSVLVSYRTGGGYMLPSRPYESRRGERKR